MTLTVFLSVFLSLSLFVFLSLSLSPPPPLSLSSVALYFICCFCLVRGCFLVCRADLKETAKIAHKHKFVKARPIPEALAQHGTIDMDEKLVNKQMGAIFVTKCFAKLHSDESLRDAYVMEASLCRPQISS